MLQTVEVMRQGRGGDAELVLDFAGDQTRRVGFEQKPHDPEASFRAQRREHVGVAGEVGSELGG